jgi:hypothetical protein
MAPFDGLDAYIVVQPIEDTIKSEVMVTLPRQLLQKTPAEYLAWFAASEIGENTPWDLKDFLCIKVTKEGFLRYTKVGFSQSLCSVSSP